MVGALSSKAVTAARTLRTVDRSLYVDTFDNTIPHADHIQILKQDVATYERFWQEFGRAVKLGAL